MGLDYSYVLRIRRERMWDVLQSLRSLAALHDGQTDIFLADGRVVEVPFLPTQHFLHLSRAAIFYRPQMELEFATSLLFPLEDDEIRNYRDDIQPDEENRLRIGCIYLYIRNAPDEDAADFVDFDFTAATTSMSQLFENSSSVRRTFVQFAVEQDAAYCFLDREENAIACWLDGEEMEEDVSLYLPLSSVRRNVRLNRLERALVNRLQNESSEEVFLAALNDESDEMRQAALIKGNELGAISDETFKAAFSDSSPHVRRTALMTMALDTNIKIQPFLLRALQDPDVTIRHAACEIVARQGFMPSQNETLKVQGDEVLFGALERAAHDENKDVRLSARHAIAVVDADRAVPVLCELLQDDDGKVRQHTAWQLEWLKDARAIDALIAVLKDESPDVREAAANALGEIGESRAVAALCAACDEATQLMSDAIGMHRSIFEALHKIGDKRAVSIVTDLFLNQPGMITHPLVQRAAMEVLERIGDAEAIGVLKTIIRYNSSSEASRMAKQTLERLGEESD